MAIPEGFTQVNLYLPVDMLDAMDEAAKAEYGRKNARSDWMRAAIADKLGADRDAGAVEIEQAFARMNAEGRAWLLEAARMAAANGAFKA